MKLTKRLLALLLAATMVLSMSACGSHETGNRGSGYRGTARG